MNSLFLRFRKKIQGVKLLDQSPWKVFECDTESFYKIISEIYDITFIFRNFELKKNHMYSEKPTNAFEQKNTIKMIEKYNEKKI